MRYFIDIIAKKNNFVKLNKLFPITLKTLIQEDRLLSRIDCLEKQNLISNKVHILKKNKSRF